MGELNALKWLKMRRYQTFGTQARTFKTNSIEYQRSIHLGTANNEIIRNDNLRKSELKRKELEETQSKLQAKKELTTLIKELERETYAKLDSRLESSCLCSVRFDNASFFSHCKSV